MKFFTVAALTALVATVSAGVQSRYEPSPAEFDGILSKFHHFMDLFKHDGAEFLKCMGPRAIKDCEKELLTCVVSRALCLTKIASCESHEAAICVKEVLGHHEETKPEEPKQPEEPKKFEDMTPEEFDGIFSKLHHFLELFKHDGIDFLKCMGPLSIKDCESKLAGCVLDRSHCLSEIAKCESKDAKICAEKLIEKHAHEHEEHPEEPKKPEEPKPAEFDGILSKFHHFMDLFKHDGAEFLKCMGPGSIHDCEHELLNCVVDRSHCLGQIAKCESKEAHKCADKALHHHH